MARAAATQTPLQPSGELDEKRNDGATPARGRAGGVPNFATPVFFYFCTARRREVIAQVPGLRGPPARPG